MPGAHLRSERHDCNKIIARYPPQSSDYPVGTWSQQHRGQRNGRSRSKVSSNTRDRTRKTEHESSYIIHQERNKGRAAQSSQNQENVRRPLRRARPSSDLQQEGCHVASTAESWALQTSEGVQKPHGPHNRPHMPTMPTRAADSGALAKLPGDGRPKNENFRNYRT